MISFFFTTHLDRSSNICLCFPINPRDSVTNLFRISFTTVLWKPWNEYYSIEYFLYFLHSITGMVILLWKIEGQIFEHKLNNWSFDWLHSKYLIEYKIPTIFSYSFHNWTKVLHDSRIYKWVQFVQIINVSIVVLFWFSRISDWK